MARFVMPIEQVVNDDASNVGAGWLLNFYLTGTSTRKDTFSDSALTTANANPVVADAAGRFGDIFLESGTYKVVLTDADAVEKWTADPVDGAAGSSGAIDAKTTAYTVTVGDATKLIDVDASGGAVTITLLPAATAGNGFEVGVRKNGTDINAVTIDADGAETINGAATRALYRDGETEWYRSNATAWFVTRKSIDPAKGTDIASAATTNLATATGNYVDITGTTTITALGTAPAGTERTVQFDGALTLTHNGTSLILPGGANITTAAGDIFEFTSLGSGNWKCTDYVRAAGVADIPATQAQMETATDTSKTVTPGRQQYHPGTVKGWVNFTVAAAITGSRNVASITDNATGDWTVNWDTDFSGTDYCVVTGIERTAGSTASDREMEFQSLAAGSVRIRCKNSAGTLDENEVAASHVVALGDQA